MRACPRSCLFTCLLLTACACAGAKSRGEANDSTPSAPEDPARETPAPPAESTKVEVPSAEEGTIRGSRDRPPWIQTDIPLSARCEELPAGLACVGVSEWSASSAEAKDSARSTAEARLAEMVAIEATRDGGDRELADRAAEEAIGPEGPAPLRPRVGGWYWEQYAKRDGPGTEFLGFLRLTLSADAHAALVERVRGAANP